MTRQDAGLGSAREVFKRDVAARANVKMRSRYLSTDAGVGGAMAQGAFGGLSPQNLFVLRQEWSPIAVDQTDLGGLNFEIDEVNMRALGERALEPEIDDILVEATLDAIVDNPGEILSELIQDLISGSGESDEVVG